MLTCLFNLFPNCLSNRGCQCPYITADAPGAEHAPICRFWQHFLVAKSVMKRCLDRHWFWKRDHPHLLMILCISGTWRCPNRYGVQRPLKLPTFESQESVYFGSWVEVFSLRTSNKALASWCSVPHEQLLYLIVTHCSQRSFIQDPEIQVKSSNTRTATLRQTRWRFRMGMFAATTKVSPPCPLRRLSFNSFMWILQTKNFLEVHEK